MSELSTRIFTAIALVLIALMAAVVGGMYFAVFVAAVATAMYYEWSRIVRGWSLSWKVGGFFYALIPALCLLWIRDRADDGLALLLWVFLITWATDVGGYFFGRAFGKRKLMPSVSPNKTWAGLYGAMAASTMFGAAWTLWAGLDVSLLLFAPLFAFAAQAGDLFESWMKRRAGVKDSGNWLPGHGGLLDRLDGLVPVAVLTFLAEIGGII